MSQLLYPTTVNAVSKQLNANYTNADAVITLTNTTSIQNKPGVCLINRIDVNGTLQSVANWTYIEFTATSGATLTGCTVISGGQDQALGKVVEFISDVTQQQRILDALALLVDVTDISVSKAVLTTGSQSVAGTKTFASIKVDDDGIDYEQIATPANPSAGRNKIYFKTGGKARILDSSGVEVPLSSSLTNTVTSHATPSINTDACDIFTITAQAEAITSMTTNLTGTPVNGQKLIIRIKDDGTARGITWGASFASRGATLPTTTVLGKYHYIGFMYNSTASVWDCVAAVVEA